MLFELRAVLQNAIMGIPSVRRAASHFHSTGLNGDHAAAETRFQSYARLASVAGKAVLELGPGQSPQVLLCAQRAGAQRCAAVDTYVYESLARARQEGIEVYQYDGIRLPFRDASFDMVWSSDVLEHVRAPQALLAECARVLRHDGLFLAHVDLRDHYHLAEEARWLDCLKYSEPLWLAMTSNRSSFVNRLRVSEWRQLFAQVGLELESLKEQRSPLLRAAYTAGRLRPWRIMAPDDIEVIAFDCVCRKA